MQHLFQAVAWKPKPADFAWTDDMVQSFIATKCALADVTMLVHARPDAPLSIHLDASDFAVGAVLQQQVKDKWESLGFFSKQLRKPETKSSAFDCELLAMYLSVRHFRFLVEGQPFTAQAANLLHGQGL